MMHRRCLVTAVFLMEGLLACIARHGGSTLTAALDYIGKYLLLALPKHCKIVCEMWSTSLTSI